MSCFIPMSAVIISLLGLLGIALCIPAAFFVERLRTWRAIPAGLIGAAIFVGLFAYGVIMMNQVPGACGHIMF